MSGTATPLSLNEIGFYFTRSAVGAGAPFGIGEDFTEACKCLAYLGFDPAAAAAPALRSLAVGDSGPALTLHAARDAVHVRSRDGRVLSALYAGPVVADRLSIEAACGEERRFLLDVTDQPVLIAGAIASAGVDTARIAARWPLRNGSHGVVELDRGIATITGLGEADIAAPAPAAVEVVLNSPASPRPSLQSTTRRLDDGKARAVEHGVVVDGAAWSAVFDYFGRCLVPTTGQSRTAGAGAGGLTDND